MRLKLGDKVLIRKYPKAGKFDPLYRDEVVDEVVEIEEKGAVVEGQIGRKRR